MTDNYLCQYCDTPREFRGWFECYPVSLCPEHKKQHGADFDRVTPITQIDVDAAMEENKR